MTLIPINLIIVNNITYHKCYNFQTRLFDQICDLSNKIILDMIAQITCFDHGQYIKYIEMTSKIIFDSKNLQIVKIKIDFYKIINIPIQNR